MEVPRTVTLHGLPSCPLPEQTPLIDLEALGDFPAGGRSGEAPRSAGQRLLFPAETRSIVARTGDGAFQGLAEVDPSGDVDVLLWPLTRPCTLAAAPHYPAAGGGRAIAHHPRENVVLIAGGDAGQTSAVVGALTFRTDTGVAEPVDAAARHVLFEPRAHASAAPFGDDLIVTGGEDPLVPVERNRRVLENAEVFSVQAHKFLTELIELHTPRTRHRSVLLPSGEVLLIGGHDGDGQPLALLEAVSPMSRSSSLGGLANLEVGRIDPEVLSLEGGGFLVLGGFDAAGAPLPDAEWLSADASAHLGTSPIPAAAHVTAAPLPGGGALVVLGCVEPAPPGDDDCDGCGCEASSAALWLEPNLSVYPIEVPPVHRPWLIPAADGAPLLIDGGALIDGGVIGEGSGGEGSGGDRIWRRFNPWRVRFEPTNLPPLPPVRESPRGAEAPGDAPGDDLTDDAADGSGGVILERPLSLDPGAFLWIEETSRPRVRGLRTAVRHRFTRDLALLTLTHPEDAGWPLHLAPARPGAAVYGDRALELTEAPVWLTDVDFADVDLELRWEGSVPVVYLNREPFGDAERPWPGGSEGDPLRVERRGATVTLLRGGERLQYALGAPLGDLVGDPVGDLVGDLVGDPVANPLGYPTGYPTARVSVGFASGPGRAAGPTILRGIEVTRVVPGKDGRP